VKIHLVNMRQSALDAMIRRYEVAEPKLHELVDDPEAADIILFVGSWDVYASVVTGNPLPKLYPEKCFVYLDADAFVPILPGVYANTEKPRLFDMRRAESQMFIDALNPFVEPQPDAEKKYLFTFAGGSTSLLRKKLYKIDFGRPDVIVKNTSNYHHWDLSQGGREERQKDYATMIAQSHFGLCPRGASAGGLRLYEVMQMGVAPVLLSDTLKLPYGPDWDKFLIHIPERKIRQLPEILDRYVPESAERGRLARLAWEQWFAPPVVFNNIIAVCVRTRENRRVPERWIHAFWGFMLWKWRLRRSFRTAMKALVLRVFKLLGLRFIYALNQSE
jgi:hypothetical protein